MASVAHGNEGWPWSAARQGMAGSFGCHGGIAARRRALVAACSSTVGRGRLDGTGKGEVSGRACRRALMARQRARRGSGAAMARQQRSERACVLAQMPAHAERQGERGREREEREKESGERKTESTL